MEDIKKIAYYSNSLERFLYSVFTMKTNDVIGVGFLKANRYMCYVYNKNRFVKTFLKKSEINNFPYRDSIDNKIILFSNIEFTYTDEERTIILIMASKLYFIEILRKFASNDELTKLTNRLLGEELIKEKLETKEPISILLLDIDDFKKVNDMYGHEKGDEVLKDVASFLRLIFREEDIVIRWGGEEFLVVISGISDIETLKEVLKRIKQEERKYFAGKEIPVTLSYGATIIKEGESFDTIVNRVDSCLYLAKGKYEHNLIKAFFPKNVVEKMKKLKPKNRIVLFFEDKTILITEPVEEVKSK